MTTSFQVTTDGYYVATVKIDGKEVATVGPGREMKKSFYVDPGDHACVFEITERASTAKENAAIAPEDAPA